jgi:hypothetical protein
VLALRIRTPPTVVNIVTTINGVINSNLGVIIPILFLM